MKFADLHLHTRYSDGTLTPQELVGRSIGAGLSAIAITDHDTVAGIDSAMEEAAVTGFEVLPGIELTAEYEGIEIHILGYLFDRYCPELLERIADLNKRRVERVYKIIDKLNESGLSLDPQKVFDIASGGIVGRLHIARAMAAEGLVANTYEAFQKYIGDKGPAFILGFRFSPRQAIELIKTAGGVPVLAHPNLMHKDELIPEFVGFGLMGLEAYYPEHSQGMVNFYLDMAKTYGLVVTGGSDYHGAVKPDVKLGCLKLDYKLVEELKLVKEKL